MKKEYSGVTSADLCFVVLGTIILGSVAFWLLRIGVLH